MTLRKSLESVYAQTGRMPPDLAEAVELPELTAHIWADYQQVEAYREYGDLGPKMLTPAVIRDWCWATGSTLSTWEISVILRLGLEFLASKRE